MKNNDLQNNRKLKIEQHETHLKPVVNSCELMILLVYGIVFDNLVNWERNIIHNYVHICYYFDQI